MMGSDSDAGGAIADETMTISFNTDGTGSLRLNYWVDFRRFAASGEYFDVLIDGNIVQHLTAPSGFDIGLQVVDIQAYNNGSPHTLSFHYYADYGWVASFDDVIITNEVVAECPPNGIVENEPDCYVGYVDATNGGCSVVPTGLFTPIALGDTICGKSGVISLVPTARDNDWYQFTTPGVRTVHFEGTANYPIFLLLYQPGSELTCPATLLANTYTQASGDTARLAFDLPAGTWWFRTCPINFTVNAPCATSRYVFWLYADPPLQRDARVVSVDSPTFYRVAAGEATPVQVTVTNFGEDAAYDFDVTVNITGTISGQTYTSTRTATDVGQLENVQLTFDTFTPSCLEDYSIIVTCSPVNDQVPDNNELASSFRSIATGYDTYTDGTLYWSMPSSIVSENCVRFRVPAGHTATLHEAAMVLYVSTAGVPVTPKIYATDGPNGYPGTVLWTGTPFNVPSSAWYFIDLSATGLTLTSDFYVGYSTVPTTGPALGADPLLDYVGVNFSYYGGQWVDSYDIWVVPPDYHIWLDYDITGGNFTDGEATSIDSPVGTLIGAGPFDVLATVTNTGLGPITGASATVIITGPGGAEFTNTITGIDLATGASAPLDFGDWTPSQGLSYFDVDLTLTVSGDQNVCNNTATVSPYVLAGDVFYSEDFEADNGGLTETIFPPSPSIWAWGVDAVAGAHSGTKVWGTNLAGLVDNYVDNACAALRTSPIAIPAGGGVFAFYAWYRTEDAWDFCNVKISVDGGATFILLTPLTGYDMLESGSLCALMVNQEGFTGIHPVWALQAFDLTPYAGDNAIFSIDFGSDTNTNDHGFFLDDIMVIVPPVGGCDYTPGDINGNGSANGIDVTFGVSYLKGGNAPPDECNPPCTGVPDPFYAAMDVNGNCTANGIDITYFVAYLKGQQPALRYCEDCPPARANTVEPISHSEK